MNAHPSKEELSGFVRGLLPPDNCDTVADHLDRCAACQETIRGLETHQDTLLRGLRQPPSTPPADAECRRAIDNIAAMAARQVETPAADGTALLDALAAKTLPEAASAGSSGPSRAEFAAALVASGVVEEKQWEKLQRTAPDIAQAVDAAALARLLIQRGVLTRFQASALYQGKSKALVFGDYLVLERIGAGGMGQVFKARHRRMDRLVALKVLARSLMNSPDAVQRFQREVKAAARLIHPNIVTAFDAGVQDGIHFLVMEFVDGGDLAQRVKQGGTLPVDEAVDAILQAARGLTFAHAHNVVHRDIKPANLLVDGNGTVKILDMGLARIDDPLGSTEDDGLTHTGQVMGTVDYMAPEQAFNTRDATAAADVYSLGCTLYRLLTGKPVFDGQTVVEKILAHREHSAPDLAGLRADVPEPLSVLFAQMVAKRAEERPTMSEVVSRLEAILAGTPAPRDVASPSQSVAAPLPKGRRVQPAPAAQPATALPAAGGQKPPRKKLLLAGGAGALALLLLCGVWVVIKRSDGTTLATVEAPEGARVEVHTEPPAAVAARPNTPAPTAGAPAAVTAAPAGRPVQPSAPSTAAVGEWIDLLQLIDPAADAVFGPWSKVNGELLTGRAKGSRLLMPVTPTGGYRIEVEFTRTSGSQTVAVMIPLGAVQSMWAFDYGSGTGPRASGFLFVDDRPIGQDLNRGLIPEGLVNGRRYRLEIEASRQVDGPSVVVKLDGRVLQSWNDNPRRLSMPIGTNPAAPNWSISRLALGLGSFDSAVTFHAARLQLIDGELRSERTISGTPPPVATQPPTPEWTPLFNGRDLTGWKVDPARPGDWRVEQGVLKGSGSRSTYLFSERGDWTDFHLRAEARINSGGSAGVTCRAPFGKPGPTPAAGEVLGYLAKINANSKADVRRTGSLYVMQESGYSGGTTVNTSAVQPDEWFTFEVLAEGNRVVVRVNGQTTTDFHDTAGLFTRGHLALQAYQSGTQVEFRRIEIKELRSASSPPPLAVAPFDATQARAHQEAWAAHLGTTVETTNSVGMKLVLIPPGEFLMGFTDEQIAKVLQTAEGSSVAAPASPAVARPFEKVVIRNPLLIGATEVTIGQFRRFVEASGYVTEAEQIGWGNSASTTAEGNVNMGQIGANWRTPGQSHNAVGQVTWNDAVAYCNWLSAQENATYRLPTEAEWEYACRAGTTTLYSFGDDDSELPKYGWNYKTRPAQAHPVAQLLPNAFGLFDMHGNVTEWCRDGCDSGGRQTGSSNGPITPTESKYRVYRGGNTLLKPYQCSSAYRFWTAATARNWAYGFRVVCELPQPAVEVQIASTTIPAAPVAAAPTSNAAHAGPQPPAAIAPFDTTQARAHQEAWAAHLGTTVETTNSLGMKLVLIPPGEFLMGSSADEIATAVRGSENNTKYVSDCQSEGPQHQVVVSSPLLCAATEVTNEQFQQFVSSANYRTEAEINGKATAWRKSPPLGNDDFPVDTISWNDAVEFCNWLSRNEGFEPVYAKAESGWQRGDSDGYRLPSEAEWEYACRAGSAARFSFGDDLRLLDEYCWHGGNSGSVPHAVATRKPNAFSLFDMHGNAYEWCGDWFAQDWYKQTPLHDPVGPPSGELRIVRGGHSGAMGPAFRSAHRMGHDPSQGRLHGFRVVRGLRRATPGAVASTAPNPSAAEAPAAPTPAAQGTQPETEPTPAAEREHPAQKRLAAAQSLYKTELERIGKLVADDLSRREAVARRQADKQAVEVVAAEREAFQQREQAPRNLRATIRPRLNAARIALVAAYETAIKDFVRTGNDALADATSRQLEEFRQLLIDRGAVAAAYANPPRKLSPQEFAEVNRAAATWALSLGARVVLTAPNGATAELKIDALPPGPFVVKEIHLPFDARQVGDADMDQIAPLAELTHLTLRGSGVTDAGVARLASLPKLQAINLHACRVTDLSLVVLAELKSLRSVDVGYNPKITDAGLEELIELPLLETLNIYATGISDAGVRLLAACRALRKVELKNIKVSGDTFRFLQAANPKLQISL